MHSETLSTPDQRQRFYAAIFEIVLYGGHHGRKHTLTAYGVQPRYKLPPSIVSRYGDSFTDLTHFFTIEAHHTQHRRSQASAVAAGVTLGRSTAPFIHNPHKKRVPLREEWLATYTVQGQTPQALEPVIFAGLVGKNRYSAAPVQTEAFSPHPSGYKPGVSDGNRTHLQMPPGLTVAQQISSEEANELLILLESTLSGPTDILASE
jgi:hypothetical protein